MAFTDDLPVPSTERLRTVLRVNLGLLEIAERIRRNWNSHAAAVGLSSTQIKVLLMLRPDESVPMRSLAARLDYDTSNLTTLVDRLERRGAVARHTDPDDRRIKALRLTDEGERLRMTFWHNLTEDAGPLGPLDESGLTTLAALLDRLESA